MDAPSVILCSEELPLQGSVGAADIMNDMSNVAEILDWPKSLFRPVHNILWKKPIDFLVDPVVVANTT